MTRTRQRAILMTGATGFVGGYLADRLHQLYSDVPMFLLVRGSKDQCAEERITTQIPTFRGRIVKGDIGNGEKLGLIAGDRDALSRYNLEVWHIAANTKFREKERKEIFHANETGTHNVLSFAKAVGAQRLHYVSTAYIAGDRTGLQDGRAETAYEDEIFVGQRFRNPYEESKYKAEHLIRDAASGSGLPTTIYRMSIAVGESRNGRATATAFSGYYTFMAAFKALRDSVSRDLTAYRPDGVEQRGDNLYMPVRIWGAPDATINLICIDYLCDLIVRLAAMPQSIGKTFHVVNPTPPGFGWIIETSMKVLQIEGVRILEPRARPSSIHCAAPETELERMINRTLAYYQDYVSGEPRFDQRNVREVLGDIPPHPVMDEQRLRMLLQYAIANNFGRSMPSRTAGGRQRESSSTSGPPIDAENPDPHPVLPCEGRKSFIANRCRLQPDATWLRGRSERVCASDQLA